MPYIKGKASSLQHLLAKIVDWATDTEIHGDDAWELVRNDPWPRGTIFKAKGVNGINSCYIGIMLVTHVKGESYRNWLLQTKNLIKEFVRPGTYAGALAMDGGTILHVEGEDHFELLKDRADPSKGKYYFTLSGIDIVNANGTALAFGVFKQYNDGLDWNEQPGCIEFGDLAQYPIYYTIDSGNPVKISPPIYPGVGYPGIGMPGDEPSTGSFDFWITKDASRITVITNNKGQWDVGHAGMLIPFHAKNQYAFPAVVTGSCTGLRTIAYRAGLATTIGAKIDYSYTNYSLSRSMPIAPCTCLGPPTAPTNTQLSICLPNGKWEFFSNWTQLIELITESFTYFSLNRPIRLPSFTLSWTPRAYVKPTNLELTDVAQVLDSGDDVIVMEPLELVHTGYRDILTSESPNMLGTIWNMYWPSNSHKYGELEIDGKQYLLLPNCWEDRPWHLPTRYAKPTTDEALLAEYNEILAYGKQFRILIGLE